MANALMQRPWNFEVADASKFTQPVMQGIEAGYRDRQQGVENERQNKLMGFQEQRLVMEKAKADRDAETAEAHQFGKAMSALASQPPEVVAQYAPQIFAKHPKYAAKFAENGIPMDNPQVAVKMLAQQYGDYDPQAIEKNRAAIEASKASTASSYASTAATNAQAQQLSRQSPDWRQANAQRFGIDPNTPEGKAFVISGQYTPKSNRVTLTEGQTIGDIVPGADGNSTFRPIVQGNEKPAAEYVAKASNFAARMVEAERNTRKLLDGVDPIDGTKGQKFGASDRDVALTASLPEAVRNMVISGPHQQYRQAAEQWIRAFLRKESGAAIGADEFKRDFVVYFPQPGDGPEVIKQKAVARASAMAGIAGEAGSYFEKKNPEAAKQLNVYKGGGQAATAPDQGGQPRRVNNAEEAMRLPPGTQFMTPDGRLKVRP
jgi:hypothetical protein